MVRWSTPGKVDEEKRRKEGGGEEAGVLRASEGHILIPPQEIKTGRTNYCGNEGDKPIKGKSQEGAKKMFAGELKYVFRLYIVGIAT
jgi:hypothetical protein